MFARTFCRATQSKSIRRVARSSRCSQEKGGIPFGRVKREIWNSCRGTPPRDFPQPSKRRPKSRRDVASLPLLSPSHPCVAGTRCLLCGTCHRLISLSSLKTLLSDPSGVDASTQWCFKVFKRLLAPFVSLADPPLEERGRKRQRNREKEGRVGRCFEILSDWWMRLLRGRKRKPLYPRQPPLRDASVLLRSLVLNGVSHFLKNFNSSSPSTGSRETRVSQTRS